MYSRSCTSSMLSIEYRESVNSTPVLWREAALYSLLLSLLSMPYGSTCIIGNLTADEWTVGDTAYRLESIRVGRGIFMEICGWFGLSFRSTKNGGSNITFFSNSFNRPMRCVVVRILEREGQQEKIYVISTRFICNMVSTSSAILWYKYSLLRAICVFYVIYRISFSCPLCLLSSCLTLRNMMAHWWAKTLPPCHIR